DARAYADLIRLPSRSFSVHVASTPEEAAGPAAEAEIFYCWGLPRRFLGQAKRLRWIQCMGAGVERLLVPELPAQVRITRAAGIFGPWMAEYSVGWCLWVTQRMRAARGRARLPDDGAAVGPGPRRLRGSHPAPERRYAWIARRRRAGRDEDVGLADQHRVRAHRGRGRAARRSPGWTAGRSRARRVRHRAAAVGPS